MAEYTKEFYIKIGGIKESVENIQTLESVLDKVEKQVENINKNGGFTVVSKEANKNTKEAIDLAKAQKIANDEVASSYRDKQKALTALGKEIKTMVAEDEQSIQKQGELIGQYNELNTKLKNFDAAMGNHQRNVGDYRGALRETTQQIKEMQGEMAQMLQNGISKADPAFQALAKRAGELQDAISDAREETKRYASDTKQLDDVINVAQSATAAFQLYKGVMSEFGIENKKAEETIASLMQTASMLQSLQTLSNTLKEGSATAKLFQGAMKALGLEFLTTSKGATSLATAEGAATVATNTLSTASKALRIALASIGIGLIILAVTTLITHWEDLVGWFKKTFPVLGKLRGWFNSVRSAISGLIESVVAVIKSFGSLGDMMKAIFSGEWGKAADIAKQNFKNITNAFKKGYADEMAEIQEEVTAKAAEESNKRTKQELEELKIQERNNKTYSKKLIALQQKEFDERKKMARGNQEELNKIKLEEMQFYADVEDKKTAAAKAGAAARTKAAKEEAAEAKKEAEELKRQLTASRELTKTVLDNSILEQKQLERLKQLRLEGYESGPLEKYQDELKGLLEIQKKIFNLEQAKEVREISSSLSDNVKQLNKATDAWKKYQSEAFEDAKKTLKEQGKAESEAAALAYEYAKKVENVWQYMFGQLANSAETTAIEVINSLGLNDADLNIVLNGWEKINGLILKSQDDANAKIIDKEKKTLSVMKNEMADFSDDFERRYKELIDKVKDSELERPVRDKIFGIIDKKKTLENLEKLKTEWNNAYIYLGEVVSKEEKRWDEYLENVKRIYGEDSSAFKKAQKEKEDALKPLQDKLTEVAKRAATPTSTETDYTGDNKAGASTKPNRKLWHDKNDKKSNGDPYSFIDNMANLFDSLDEMVLNPAMETFSMFMDFAIEETAQKLEEVQKLHDDALDKVNESADKIKELNESLKDSANNNTEATKQQLADEQLLYAQRLAEEKKLAEQEKALKNKQEQQRANARKMELRYQMVMAIANTAQGASKALADWGWPLGAVFAGIMAALGAIQVALIAKQIGAIKPIKYAEGGLLQGPSHSQGGIPIGRTGVEVEGNEYVVNKRSTAKYLPLLEAINAEGRKKSISNTDKRIRRYANGGQLNFDRVDENLKENNNTNRLMNAIDKIDMQPVVAVKDIWKVEDRLVKVRSLAGK